MEQYISPNEPRFSANSDSKTIQNAVDEAARGGRFAQYESHGSVPAPENVSG